MPTRMELREFCPIPMTSLSAIPELLKRTKALAALDLILSPEWEYRYYSFNSAWSPGEKMASMRNGCGDEWWLVFHTEDWAALKGLNHESEAWTGKREELSAAIRAVMPPDLSAFSKEPAFRWDSTGFAYFCLPPKSKWIRANDLTQFSGLDAGEDDLLCHLSGDPSDYSSFAEDYYERAVSVNMVADIFLHAPITEQLVSSLNPDITLKDISNELFAEIGYPR
jgi:hypothetical protein